MLTIAHLDHDKENWAVKDERLKALCQRCHLRYDSEHHQKNAARTRELKKRGVGQMDLPFTEETA